MFVYQAVRITMTKQSKKETIARSIYRDTQGKRQPKRVALNATQEQVKSALTVAVSIGTSLFPPRLSKLA